MSLVEASLLHFQLEQVRLRAARRCRIIAFVLIEGIAALIQSVDHILALVLLVVVLLETVWRTINHRACNEGETETDLESRTEGKLISQSDFRGGDFTHGSRVTGRISLQVIFQFPLRHVREVNRFALYVQLTMVM